MTDITPAPQNAPHGIPVADRIDPDIAAQLRGQVSEESRSLTDREQRG